MGRFFFFMYFVADKLRFRRIAARLPFAEETLNDIMVCYCRETEYIVGGEM